jgi:transposase
MTRFVVGDDRGQSTLFPERLDDYVGEDNPVRAIDVFVEELDLAGLGFEGVQPLATGRPAYHPATLLKIYVYGYLNRVQSSRRLERECQRNVELVWLTGRLMPDFKTIADFRKDNGEAIRKVCRAFVLLCQRLDLLGDASVAIDGSMFKAVNAWDRNFTEAKVKRRLEQIDVYVADDDVYLCPAGERLTYRFTNEEEGKTLRRYWTTACQTCALKAQCTTGERRRISRWEHETILETVQDRLDRNPDKMRVRRQTVEHPFGTIKAWMGATHFQMRTLPKVATEMALHVLAYNMKRVMRILGVGELMAAMRA